MRSVLSRRVNHIPSLDTISLLISWDDVDGPATITFAAHEPKFELTGTGTEGTIELKRRFGDAFGHRVANGQGQVADY